MNVNKNALENPGAASLSRRNRLQMALILGAAAMIGPLSIDMYLPALPALGIHFNVGDSQVQMSLSLFLLGLALGQLVIGPVSDMIGRRRLLLGGMLLYTAASLLCAVSPSIGLLLLLRFLQGLAGSAGPVLARAIVRDMYSGAELARFFSLLMIVNGLGPILAPVIGGQLLLFTSWQGVFIILCAVGLLFSALIMLRLPETLPRESRSSSGLSGAWRAFAELLGNKYFMGCALCQGFVTAGMFAYISGSSFVLQNKFDVSPQMYSLIFAVNGLGLAVSGHLAGRLAERVGEERLLVGGLLAALAGGTALLGVAAAGGGLIPTLVCLFAAVSSVGMVSTTSFSLAMRDMGDKAGSASALLGVLPLLLGGCAAPLVGLGGQESGFSMALVIAGAEACAIISYLLLVKTYRK